MSAFGGKADTGRPFRRIGSPAGGACYLFIMIVIRHETTAAARWALLLIVRTLSNDAIPVAVWTGFGFHPVPPWDILANKFLHSLQVLGVWQRHNSRWPRRPM